MSELSIEFFEKIRIILEEFSLTNPPHYTYLHQIEAIRSLSIDNPTIADAIINRRGQTMMREFVKNICYEIHCYMYRYARGPGFPTKNSDFVDDLPFNTLEETRNSARFTAETQFQYYSNVGGSPLPDNFVKLAFAAEQNCPRNR